MKRCKSTGCRSELTDQTKDYCSQHIYSMAILMDITQWLIGRYEIERMAKQNEADVEYEADI